MASANKSKRRMKGQTVDLNTFLGDDNANVSGFTTCRVSDWGDAMENEELDDKIYKDKRMDKYTLEKIMLPTAPKAARGPDIDHSKVPTKPPFTAYLGNLPYEISEQDIFRFFNKLNITSVRLPTESGDRVRTKGFGYAEFDNREALLEALALNNECIKNRPIKVSLAAEHDGGDRRDDRRGGMGRDRIGGDDRTAGDWRAAREETPRDDRFQRSDRSFGDRGFGDRDRDRDYYRGRGSFERDRDFGFGRDRDQRGTYGSDQRGFSGDRDRDFGRSGNRSFGDRDRFERSDRGFDRGGRKDFGSGFDRRRDDDDDRSARPPSGPSASDASQGRPKLQLKPRSVPLPLNSPAEVSSASSIFGGAKPVDTASREKEIEERLARQRLDSDSEKSTDSRIRKTSTSSGGPSRSRRNSDSAPSSLHELDDEETPEKVPSSKDETTTRSAPPKSKPSRLSDKDGSDGKPPSGYPRNGVDEFSESKSPPVIEELQPKEILSKNSNNISPTRNGQEVALKEFEEPEPPNYASSNKFTLLDEEEEDDAPQSASE